MDERIAASVAIEAAMEAAIDRDADGSITSQAPVAAGRPVLLPQRASWLVKPRG